MRNLLWSVAVTVALSACGGGGGGTAATGTGASGSGTGGSGSGGSDPVQGLTLPQNLSLLSPKDGGAGAGAGKTTATASKPGSASLFSVGSSAYSKIFSDSDTDYSTDDVNVYVYDESMESLNLINEIVCYMGQTASSEMVNRGAYIALIDEERCRQGELGASTAETGQSSAGDTTDFARWTILSERDDNESPQRVRLWVPGDDGSADAANPMDRQTILVDVTVTEAVSDSLPFGSFSMNFKGVVDGESQDMPGVDVEVMRGMLATVENDDGSPQFRFINIGGDSLESGLSLGFGFEEAANVRLGDADGTSGLALTHNARTWSFEVPGGFEEGSHSKTYAVDYDSSHFLSDLQVQGDQVSEELVCRSRDEFDVQVWRYNLYHEVDTEFRGQAVVGGDRVELETGFPFSFDGNNDGVAESYGWIGYHGVWTESDFQLEDGQAIQRFDWDSDQTIPYTVRVAPGRLTRRSASDELLSALVGDEFEFWGEHPTLNVHGKWMVEVNQDLGFSIVSRFEWGDDGRILSDAIDHDENPETPDVAVASALTPAHNEVLWLWSQSLGGSVVYTHDDAVAAVDRRITFFAEETVYSQDSTLFPAGVSQATLYCYEQCLKGGLTQEDVAGSDGVVALYHDYAGTPLTYTASAIDGKVVLTDDSNGALVSAVDLDLSALGHEWGIHSGEMLPEPLADPSMPWQVYDAEVSYRWESGPNAWNVVVSATDSTGVAVDFDRPLEFQYVHSTANDANGSAEYDGKRFLLHYGGAGNLHGFPWREDPTTGRWYSAVTLADGVILSAGGNDFVVKGVEKEQSMREVDLLECAGLDTDRALLDDSLALPGVGDIGTVSFTRADRPEVSGLPAVVDGVVQSQDGVAAGD